MSKNDLKELRNDLEKLLMPLAPKLDIEGMTARVEESLKRTGTEVQENSFLDPVDEKRYVYLNSVSPLGFSSAHRIGKG